MIIIGALSWVVPKIYLMTLVLGTGIPHIILGAKYSKSGLSLAFNVFWKKAFVLMLLPLIPNIKLKGRSINTKALY
jgi:hypothetical protein